MNAVENVERGQLAQRPAIKPGDTVKVHVKVREGDKERIQVFEGMVIGMHRGGARATFTVRKVSFGQGVERIFPLHSPTISKVEVTRSAAGTSFESQTPGMCFSGCSTTAAATTGPARQPRPTSSTPATCTNPTRRSVFSSVRMAGTRTICDGNQACAFALSFIRAALPFKSRR